MLLFGICYISPDGLGVTATETVPAEDLDEAMLLARLDPARPCPSTYSMVEIWQGGDKVFCGDPNKAQHRAAPEGRCGV